jgi:phosphatidylinositol glycan class B
VTTFAEAYFVFYMNGSYFLPPRLHHVILCTCCTLCKLKFVLLLVLFRLFNSLFVRTSFVADEYWQSLEVAHRMVYGYGHLTWEWTFYLRSSLFPFMYAALFRMFETLSLRIDLLAQVKILQSILAAAGDVALFKCAERYFGLKTAKVALFLQLICWFHFYTCTRTLVTTLEALVTVASLAWWPFPLCRSDTRWRSFECTQILIFSSLICIIRPTATIFFAALSFQSLLTTPLSTFSAKLIPCASIALFLTIAADRSFYATWVFPPWHFLRANVLDGLSSFYGTHPFFWYFSSALPTALLTIFPLSLLGVVRLRNHPIVLASLLHLAVLSTVPHKELRFLQATLPVFLIAAAHAILTLSRLQTRVYRLTIAAILLLHIPVAFYTALVHQRATLAAVSFLANDLRSRAPSPTLSVLFLTPCHATPLYSHLHVPVPTTFLRCEPLVALHSSLESDVFRRNETRWLEQHVAALPCECPLSSSRLTVPSTAPHFNGLLSGTIDGMSRGMYSRGAPTCPHPLLLPVPSHIVAFDSTAHRIAPWLDAHGFVQAFQTFHTHVPQGWEDTHLSVFMRECRL